MNYRKKECYPIIKLPESLVDENRGKICTKCCNNQLVLADTISNDTHKNDFTGVYIKKATDTDTAIFTMENCEGEIVSNQGETAIFPNDNLAVGYIFDWKKILNTHGVGIYSIKLNYTIAGIAGAHTVRVLQLKKFNRQNVKESVRIYSQFNSYFQKDNVDFTNSNFKDTVRFNGFFGFREPGTDVNNLIDKGRTVVKITRENVNKYTLNTDPIEICMSKQLIDFHLLNEDTLKISDYNRFNHDFQIHDKEVSLVDEPKIEYMEFDRRAKISVIFGDRKLEDKSYYR
jgi:hypothetical protein